MRRLSPGAAGKQYDVGVKKTLPAFFFRFFVFSLSTTAAMGILLFLFVWIVHPPYLTRAVNSRLKEIPGYKARVARVKVEPWGARVVVDGVAIEKLERTAPAMFLKADRVTADLSWGGIIGGDWEADVFLDKPEALFLMRQRLPGQPRKVGVWQAFFSGLRPFRVGTVKIRNGDLRIQNEESIPPADFSFNGIIAEGANMANRADRLGKGPARLEGQCRFMGHAPLRLFVEVVPFQEHATFRMKGQLDRFELKTLNPSLRHFTGTDIEAGVIDVEAELSAEGAEFSGNVKRRVEGLDVIGRAEEHLGFIQRVKEFVFEVWLKGRQKDGVMAAEYRLAGPLGYRDADVFLACVWAAKSAFLQSLRPVIPPEIRMGTPEQAEEEWMALQDRERKKAGRHPGPR